MTDADNLLQQLAIIHELDAGLPKHWLRSSAIEVADALASLFLQEVRESTRMGTLAQRMYELVGPEHEAEADLLISHAKEHGDAHFASQHGGRLPEEYLAENRGPDASEGERSGGDATSET